MLPKLYSVFIVDDLVVYSIDCVFYVICAVVFARIMPRLMDLCLLLLLFWQPGRKDFAVMDWCGQPFAICDGRQARQGEHSVREMNVGHQTRSQAVREARRTERECHCRVLLDQPAFKMNAKEYVRVSCNFPCKFALTSL